MFQSKYNIVLKPYACIRFMKIEHIPVNNNFNLPSLN